MGERNAPIARLQAAMWETFRADDHRHIPFLRLQMGSRLFRGDAEQRAKMGNCSLTLHYALCHFRTIALYAA